MQAANEAKFQLPFSWSRLQKGAEWLWVETRLGLQYGQQATQLGVGFVFGELLDSEQPFVRLAGEFLSSFGRGPVQLERENGSGTGLVQRTAKPLGQFRNQFLRLN